MGKYMRKSKADPAETEVAQSSLGVRTRAKTLAMRQQAVVSSTGGGSYLELRSRKLEKPIGAETLRMQQSVRRNRTPNFKSRACSRLRVSSTFAVESQEEGVGSQTECERLKDCDETGFCGVGDFDTFLGGNSPDFHAVDR